MGTLTGLLLLARFKAAGFASFVATPQGFVNSLTPLLAIGLIAGIRPLLAGSLRAVLLHLLTMLVALLAPAVISHLLSRLWHRESRWLHYIVAFNWCQSAITLLLMLVILATIGGPGQPQEAMLGAVACILAYWLALCWFMLWRGLDIGRGKAAFAVLATNLGTGLLVLLPQWLAEGLR
jgi:hypothetical protein